MFRSQGPEAGDELGGDYCIQFCVVADEQPSYIVFILFKWERAVWSAIEMASSVDLLQRYVNWSGPRCLGLW